MLVAIGLPLPLTLLVHGSPAPVRQAPRVTAPARRRRATPAGAWPGVRALRRIAPAGRIATIAGPELVQV